MKHDHHDSSTSRSRERQLSVFATRVAAWIDALDELLASTRRLAATPRVRSFAKWFTRHQLRCLLLLGSAASGFALRGCAAPDAALRPATERGARHAAETP